MDPLKKMTGLEFLAAKTFAVIIRKGGTPNNWDEMPPKEKVVFIMQNVPEPTELLMGEERKNLLAEKVIDLISKSS